MFVATKEKAQKDKQCVKAGDKESSFCRRSKNCSTVTFDACSLKVGAESIGVKVTTLATKPMHHFR